MSDERLVGANTRDMSQVRLNEDWILALSGTGKGQEAAINDLRQYLLKVSLYTLYRYLKDLRALSHAERLALAEDCAQEALITVLHHLGDFKGESKFTTWAFKFAVNISLACARREGWRHLSLEQFHENTDGFDRFFSNNHSAPVDLELQALQAEVTAVLDEAINRDLTDKQRQVFRMIVFEQIPMDAVVQRMGTNRNSVYKTLHDARKKLKKALRSQELKVDDIFSLFGE